MVLKAKNGRKSQLWWFDQKTRTVRNEQFRHLTFSIANNGRTVKLVKQRVNRQWWQQFTYNKDTKQWSNPRKESVWTTAQCGDGEAHPVDLTSDKTQKSCTTWKVIYQKDAEKIETKGTNEVFGLPRNSPFSIVSRFYVQRALSDHGSYPRLRHYRAGDKRADLVFDEVSKTITRHNAGRSNGVSNRALAIQSNGRSNRVIFQGRNSRWWQLWQYKDGKLKNSHGKVLAIYRGKDRENVYYVVEKDKGPKATHQLFDIVPKDKMPGKINPGDMVPRFGMKHDRPFYLVSQNGNKRLDIIRNELVVKTASERRTQLWKFDERRLTITTF
jgi:hypothetical protein